LKCESFPENVEAPELVIHGQDDFQSERVSRMHVDALPKARFAGIPKADHFVYQTDKKEFTSLIANFLAGESTSEKPGD
jgi:pimeloyl-ACP methyl ester carboxylesterase